MAKKKLFKSKTNFTLKRLHQSGSYGNIYERDYVTIANIGATPEGQIPIYNSPSFKLSVRAGYNGQKKYNHGAWVENPESCNGSTLWTLGCMPEPTKKDTKIILKPHTRKITDFACYGSASELIRASLTDIVSKFPAELYVTDKKLKDTGVLNSDIIPKDSDIHDAKDYYIIDNPMMIDLIQGVIPEESIFSPLRYFCDSFDKYTVISGDAVENISAWEVSDAADKGCINNGDLLATIKLNNGDIEINCYYYEDALLYLTANAGIRIRPNNSIINDFFDSLDDFEKVLLNQYTDYTAKFETYVESNEDGWYVTEQEYQWPIAKGNWNLSVKGQKYSDYVDGLSRLALAYDELFTDGIWRTMTHEAISNMDLTLNKNGDDIEMPNSSKVRQTLSIIGRQFDDIKKYIDNIKKTNSVTYSQDADIPDYFLPDTLSLSGWEVKEILTDKDNTVITDPMYGARTIGYTANDANNEFMRRLKLNSKNIFAKKGTKRGIEDLLAIFGYHSLDWIKKYNGDISLKKAFVMEEYVYVAKGYGNNIAADDVVREVKRINQLKDNFDNEGINIDNVVLDYYQGLPVAEVTNGDNITRIVPWFDRDAEYDKGMYFQMDGGWSLNTGDEENDTPVYEYSISKIHYVQTIDDLYDLTYVNIDASGLYYVDSEKKYYKINDIDKHQSSDGWTAPTEEEIRKAESIIDDNKGNNPHGGNYDGGLNYLSKYGQLFKDSTFDNARQEDVEKSLSYGFNIDRQTDSIKCTYYGTVYTQDAEGIKNGEDTYKNNTDSMLRRKTVVKPYNLFTGMETEEFSEESSFSIINSKEFHITFDKAHRDFLERDVIPYVKQMIPSTTIFSYSFEDITNYDKPFVAKRHNIICDGNVCPIYGVTTNIE